MQINIVHKYAAKDLIKKLRPIFSTRLTDLLLSVTPALLFTHNLKAQRAFDITTSYVAKQVVIPKKASITFQYISPNTGDSNDIV